MVVLIHISVVTWMPMAEAPEMPPWRALVITALNEGCCCCCIAGGGGGGGGGPSVGVGAGVGGAGMVDSEDSWIKRANNQLVFISNRVKLKIENYGHCCCLINDGSGAAGHERGTVPLDQDSMTSPPVVACQMHEQ